MKQKYIKHQRDYNILASVIIMEAFFGKEMIELTHHTPNIMYLNINDGVYSHYVSDYDYKNWAKKYYKNNSLIDFKKYCEETDKEYLKYKKFIKNPKGSKYEQLEKIYFYLYYFIPIIMISAYVPIYVKNLNKEWLKICLKYKNQYDDVHRLLMNLQEKILNNLEKKDKLEKNILKYLTTAELKIYFNTKKIPEKIKERRDNLLIEFYKHPKIVNHLKRNLILNKIDPKQSLKINKKKFKGNIAFKGLIIGKVLVIRKVLEASKIKDGDILVTSMTDPRYLPAMKRAGAIITDEGGITCHAAIVARELKIPCIIGTKIATKVLKDDDMVEVDANKGIIKKIK